MFVVRLPLPIKTCCDVGGLNLHSQKKTSGHRSPVELVGSFVYIHVHTYVDWTYIMAATATESSLFRRKPLDHASFAHPLPCGHAPVATHVFHGEDEGGEDGIGEDEGSEPDRCRHSQRVQVRRGPATCFCEDGWRLRCTNKLPRGRAGALPPAVGVLVYVGRSKVQMTKNLVVSHASRFDRDSPYRVWIGACLRREYGPRPACDTPTPISPCEGGVREDSARAAALTRWAEVEASTD